MERKEWALVFGGGGGKGAYQVGIWKALREMGFEQFVTAVSGASVGSLNTALFGIGDLDLAIKIWEDITPSQFLDLEVKADQDGDGRTGIFSREGLEYIMKHKLDLNKVSSSEILLYANASKMVGSKLETVYFHLNGKSADLIGKILLASSAIPFVYEPVKVGDYWYQDGGLKDNLPIIPLYQMGYRKFILCALGKLEELPEKKFPGAEFINLSPEKSLGGLISGTLDFTAKGVSPRLETGYRKGLEILGLYKNKKLGNLEN